METIDSLDIKPPQAHALTQKMKKREIHESKSHHKKSDRHREERSHSHRSKHHRDKQRDREHYQRERERYYKEKQAYEASYKEAYGDVQYLGERAYRERKDEMLRGGRHSDVRKFEERKIKESREIREVRYTYRELEKHRREKYEDDRKERGDKTLQDLRERLISKRSIKEEDYRPEKAETHKERRMKDDTIDSAFQGAAGMLVKEIIDISTSDDRRHKREDKYKELIDEERLEQELRRVKLLEAGMNVVEFLFVNRITYIYFHIIVLEREMARQKEESRLQRQRRHQERQAKRKLEEENAVNKRMKSDELNIVTVSDNTDDEEMGSDYAEQDRKSERSERSEASERDSSTDSHVSEHSNESSRSRDASVRSERKSRSRSASTERSVSPSYSVSRSPKQIDNEITEETEENKEITTEQETPKIDEDLPPYYPAIQGCRSVEEFQCLNKIEEGTYGVVYRARDKRTEEIVALKRLKMEKEKEGFPITSLREINTLLKGQHPNIVTVREIVVGSNMDKIFIVMDYVEHDLKSLMETMRHKKQMFMPGEVKCLLKQLLSAVAHLHDNWILHRDLKTSNLLLSHKGILKVGDFGLAREYGSPLKAYTPIVVTLWYRAPELLLCTKEYSTPIDMWSVGCIFAELLLMNALFPGKSEVDQLNRIFKELGTPNENIWTGFNKLPAVQKMKFNDYPVSNLRTKFNMLSELGLALLTGFLTYDPVKRLTAEKSLDNPYFNEVPLPIDPAMFPTWPAKSELGHRRALAASPKPPSGGGEYKQLVSNQLIDILISYMMVFAF